MDSDDEDIKAWLNGFKDDVIDEFGLSKQNDIEWEKNRNSFIDKMRRIVPIIEEGAINLVHD